MGRDVVVRTYALALGVAFTLAGIGGFVSLVTSPIPADAPHLTMDMGYGLLLGLFPVNIVHNLFHLTIGALGLLAYPRIVPPLLFMRGFAVVLGALTIMGMLPGFNTLFGVMPIYGHAIWLHGVEALVAFFIGFMMKPDAAQPAPQ